MLSKKNQRQAKKTLSNPLLWLALPLVFYLSYTATDNGNVPTKHGFRPRSFSAIKDTTSDTCQVKKLDFPFRTVLIEQSPNYKMFVYGPEKDKIISYSIFHSNGKDPFERHLQVLMEKQLKGRVPNQTMILDIGANIGLHSLNLASKGFPVHAFEPAPANFNFLKCSKVINQFDNLVLNNFGLSSKDAELCIRISSFNRGGAQLNTDKCPDAEKVVIKKLDDYFDTVLNGRSPYMIKMDIEGYEIHALIGGEKMFKKDPPKLVFSEVTPADYLKHGQDVTQFYDFFWSYDYTIYNVNQSEENVTLVKFESGDAQPSRDLFDVIMVHSSIDLVE